MAPREACPGNDVPVTTGAGLESPLVFLVGLRTLFEEAQSLRLGMIEAPGPDRSARL